MDKRESDGEIVELKQNDCKSSFISPGRGIEKKQAIDDTGSSSTRKVSMIENDDAVDKKDQKTLITSLNQSLKKAGKRLNEMLDKLDAKLTTNTDSESVDS